MKKKVSDIIIEEIITHGITDCFAVVGGGAMHIDNSLGKYKEINKIFNHHEQACAMAAEAYARMSGKIALVSVTCGPGATNAITGVVGAWEDSIPMLVLSGQVRYEISVEKAKLPLRYRGVQEYNIIPSVRGMTKYAKMITDPYSVKREIDKAIKIAMDGRRGPVWLDIPLDIQSTVIEEDEMYSYDEGYLPRRTVKEDDYEVLRKMLEVSKRPCILAGSGIISGSVKKEFREFVEQIKAPIVGGASIADVFYMEHPRFYGLSGTVGPRTGNFILQNADLIIALGDSLGYRQTGFNQEMFAPNAKIIMVDADEYEAVKPGLSVDKHIWADLKTFFAKINEMKYIYEAGEEWFRYCDMLKKKFSAYEAIEGKTIDINERVCSYFFWKKYEELSEDGSILALGNNTANSAKLQIGIKKEHQRVMTNYTIGSMGYDLPAAIGASVAAKKKVLCVTGDGSIMMNLQELQTIKHYDLPISVIVFTNDGYNAIRQTSKNFFNGMLVGCTKDTGVSMPAFEDVAKTFGFKYLKCSKNSEVEEKLDIVLNSEKRYLLEIEQLMDDVVTPKVMSRLNENGEFETPVLQDMAPFLDRDEYDKLMLW